MPEVRLTRSLTLWPAVGLAITMVVGSGVLVLPGLAYESRGESAVWSWLLAAAVCVPFLVVIASLGARYPTASGIAGFVRPALGHRVADVLELLLLAAIPGGAGLAIVAGHLVADLAGRSWLVAPVAGAALAAATAAGLRGTAFAAVLVRNLVAVFFLTLVVVGTGGLATGDDGPGPGEISGIGNGFGGVGLVFFAFVGWELMTFLSEEFLEPERDFPRMVAVSFALVTGLYLLLAVAVQVALDQSNPRVGTTPVATVAEVAFGHLGRVVVTIVGVVIVVANVNSVVMAFSRLVFASARHGRLPHALSLSDDRGTPTTAVIATAAAFGAIMVPERLGFVSQSTLFELAGSVFFTGFAAAAVAFTRAASRWRTRCFGVATCCLGIGVLANFGWVLFYPLAAVAVSATIVLKASDLEGSPSARGAAGTPYGDA